MKKFLFFLLICLVVPLLGRCGIVTVERQVLALCLSVDITEDGLFELNLQCPNVKEPGGAPSSGESDVAEGYIILAARGDSLISAIHRMEATLPASINFSQLRVCMFSSEVVASHDLRPLLMELFRFPFMRSTAVIMVTQGSASEVLHAQRVTLGVRLSSHLDALFKTLIASNYMPKSTLEACLTTIGSGRSDAVVSLGSVNPLLRSKIREEASGGDKPQNDPQKSDGNEGEGEGGGSTEAFADSFPMISPEDVSGLFLTEGPNPVEFAGAAITSDGHVVGYLSPREMVVLSHLLINGDMRAAIQGDRLQLQILLSPQDFDSNMYPEMMALFEKLQILHADAFGFGNVAATHFMTTGEWEAYGFENRYATAGLYIGIK